MAPSTTAFERQFLQRSTHIRAQSLRDQAAAEREAVNIYRDMGARVRASIERLSPTDLESRQKLLQLRRRVDSLLRGAAADLERATRKAWRTGARDSVRQTQRFLARIPGLAAINFGIVTQDEENDIVRQTVKWLNDPITQGVAFSDKVWLSNRNVTANVMRQVQFGAIDGLGTAEIGRQVNQYLADPEGTARQAGVIAGLRTRARAAREEGDKDRAARLFASAKERELQLPPAAPGVYRSPAKNAERLIRTEFAKAAQRSIEEYGKGRTWAKGVAWTLSGSHPEPDICDPYVGVYRIGELPEVPHPNCLCYWVLVPDPALTGGPPIVFKTGPPGAKAKLPLTG